MHATWFRYGLVVGAALYYVGAGYVVGHLARVKFWRSPWKWTFVALLVTPTLAMLILMAIGPFKPPGWRKVGDMQ